MTRSGLPSPSISAMATPRGFVPAVKSTFGAKAVTSITPEPVKVTIKGVPEYAVNPLTVTVIEWMWLR